MFNFWTSLEKGFFIFTIIGLGVWGALSHEDGPICLSFEFVFLFVILLLNVFRKPIMPVRATREEFLLLMLLIFIFNILTWVPTSSISSVTANILWIVILLISTVFNSWFIMNAYSLSKIVKKNVLYVSIPLCLLATSVATSTNISLGLDYILVLWITLITSTLVLSTLTGYFMYYCIMYAYALSSLIGSKSTYLDAK